MNLTAINLSAKKLTEKGISHDDFIFVLDTQARKMTIEVSLVTKYDDESQDIERRMITFRGEDYDNAMDAIFPSSKSEPNSRSNFKSSLVNHFISKLT